MVTLVLLRASCIMSRSRGGSRFSDDRRSFRVPGRISTAVAGLTGLYMTHEFDAWYRFAEPRFWWMHAMVVVWVVFTVVLYVAEPLFLHRWFHERASRDPEGTFRLVQRMHALLLATSLVTVGASVLGAHGAI